MLGIITEPIKKMPQMLRWALMIFISLVIITINVYCQESNAIWFPIRHVKIQGALTRSSESALEKIILPFTQDGFWGVEIEELQHHLASLSWVAEVSIRRQWPDSLLIVLQEQRPVAFWGNNALLSTKGTIYVPQNNQNLAKDMPILEGPNGTENTVWTFYKRLNQELAVLHLTVQHLVMTDRHAWLLLLNNGTELVLSRLEAEHELKRFVALYPKISKGTTLMARRVDLRYANGMAIEWQSSDEHKER